MSSGQFEAAMKAKPEELDDSAKDKLAQRRAEFVKQAIVSDENATDAAAVSAGMTANIKNASDAQLKVLGTDEVVKYAGSLKQSQFDDIMKSKDYTETEKKNIKQAREKQLWDSFVTSSELPFKGRKDGEIAKLPTDILTHIDAAQHLTPGSLKKMLDDDTVTSEVRKKIKDNVNTTRASGNNQAARDFFETPLGKQF